MEEQAKEFGERKAAGESTAGGGGREMKWRKGRGGGREVWRGRWGAEGRGGSVLGSTGPRDTRPYVCERGRGATARRDAGRGGVVACTERRVIRGCFGIARRIRKSLGRAGNHPPTRSPTHSALPETLPLPLQPRPTHTRPSTHAPPHTQSLRTTWAACRRAARRRCCATACLSTR